MDKQTTGILISKIVTDVSLYFLKEKLGVFQCLRVQLSSHNFPIKEERRVTFIEQLCDMLLFNPCSSHVGEAAVHPHFRGREISVKYVKDW